MSRGLPPDVANTRGSFEAYRPPRRERTAEPPEPVWARRSKWALLAVAIAMGLWTGHQLIRTVLTLAESPVAIATAVPAPATKNLVKPAEPPLEDTSRQKTALEDRPLKGAPPEETRAKEGGHNLASAALGEPLSQVLEELRALRASVSSLPARNQRERATSAAKGTTSPGVAPLPGIQAVHARPAERRRTRPTHPLQVRTGPRVRLIGADALVEAQLENRTDAVFDRAVVLELRVNGRRRQQRRVRLRVPPHGRVHLSERFSTTLPDGTYSAEVLLDPWS